MAYVVRFGVLVSFVLIIFLWALWFPFGLVLACLGVSTCFVLGKDQNPDYFDDLMLWPLRLIEKISYCYDHSSYSN